MITRNYIFLSFIAIYCLGTVTSIEFKGLQFLVNIITAEFMETKNKLDDEDGSPVKKTVFSKGKSIYSFVEYVSHHERTICYLNDNFLIDNENGDEKRNYIKVKCVPSPGNGTLQVITSVKEVVTLLAPHGNSTKRTQPGNCALILFYTRSCPGSAMVAPHFVALAKQFPNLKLAAIDAFKHHTLNTEFGIVGLPTVMLFHQGRPVMKFNDTTSTVNSFIKFLTKHTGLEPLSQIVYLTSDDFNGPLSSKVEKDTDYCLYLAWSFIILCACYYFTKSKLFTQIVEMIKRNWRESEAQHEDNN